MAANILNKNSPRPFLRWTGSKSWLIKEGIDNYLPQYFNDYHELFLGSATLFFYLSPLKEVYLYDLNEDLILTYSQIRDNVDNVINSLKRLKNSETEYYRIRSSKPTTDHTKAAKFIYLNRTSFNGIYRVNSNGEYNVPYGKRTNVDIVTENNLREVSKILQRKNIIQSDFEEALVNIKEGDLVFLDPPYTITHENNGFIEYNKKLFSWEDQERLAKTVIEIDKRKAYFILTNASHYTIMNLYEGIGKIFKRKRYSKVGGRNKTRGVFNELIITNI
jgi:DNA adenine methylase